MRLSFKMEKTVTEVSITKKVLRRNRSVGETPCCDIVSLYLPCSFWCNATSYNTELELQGQMKS